MGPVGSGKSTLINALINNDVTKTAMSAPAKATDTSSGVTDAFNTYYDFPNNAYTDSIGFGDNRFSSKDSMQSLKSILENSAIGYNKIYICVQYGRISKDIRKYINFIETIFGASILKHSSIIFTHCHDQEMTLEKYLSINAEDVKMVEIIGKVSSVIFGDNQSDQDPQLEAIFMNRRRIFLNRIKKNLDETATEEYFKLNKKGIVGKVCQAMRLFFGRKHEFAVAVNDIIHFTKAFADKLPSSKYSNYFGICSICQDNMTDKNMPIITKCHHLYHEQCLMEWIQRGQNDCPLCRGNFDDPIHEYFMPLTINA